MPYTVSANFAARLSAIEKPAAADSPASNPDGLGRQYSEYDTDVALNGDSYPPIGNQVADLSWELSGGTTKDFDLTAVPWAGNKNLTFDATGKKIVAIQLRMHSGNNAAGVLFGTQGANGYGLFGSIVPRFYPWTALVMGIVDPDQAAAVTNNLPAVAAGAKDLRFTGTDGDSWECLVVFSE